MSPPVASCGIDKAAVDVSTGDVYVVDNQHDAVDKFDASGSFLGQIAGSSTSAGTFDFGAGNENQIAVDNSGTATQGNLYVVSELSSFSGTSLTAIFAFDRDGNELWERPSFNTANPDACGVAVDPQGNPWIADYGAAAVQELNASDGSVASGSLNTSAHGNPCEIAFDAAGNLYVNNWHGSLDTYDSTGSYVATLDAGPVLDVATDLVTGDVYAIDSADGGTTWQVAEWDASGSPVAGTPFDTGSTSLTGIAINGTQRMAYVSDTSTNTIHMWDLPAPPPHTVTVVVNGSGSGSVDADSGAISGCTSSGGTCSDSYPAGGSVQLTATPDAGSQVTSMSVTSGNAAPTTCTSPSATNPCSVTVNTDLTITVTIDTTPVTVTVDKSGSGSGTVTSSPSGISCGETCSNLFDQGSTVRLAAAPATGSTFAGWSGGGCSGTGECDVVANADTTVTAAFTENAPTAVTGSATGVGDTVATLNGSANPNGNATSCHFDYGTTTAYGSVAPCASSPGSDTSAVPVSASVTGLAAGTTYHFRLVASNGGGTSTGSDATFTTTSSPPPATCPQDLAKCPPPAVKLAGFSGRRLLLRLGCTGFTGQRCSGRLTFKAVVKVRVKRGRKTKLVKKTITVATVSYSVAAGGGQSLKLKLTSAAKTALKRGGLTARASGLNGSIRLPRTKAKKHKKRH